MCVYVALFATILAVMLWCMDRDSYLEMQWLWVKIFTGRALREWHCTLEGGLVCECTEQYTLGGSVQCVEAKTGGGNVLNSLLQPTNQNQPKIKCVIHH